MKEVKNQLDSTLRVIKLRECSKVERCHTLPHHGSYTDGQHSYDAAMLYIALCPNPNWGVVGAFLVHDLGERWVGDLPAPVKWVDAELAQRHQALENRCLRALGFTINLNAEEACWLKAVDSLELWIWAHEQLAMGNAGAAVVIGNLNSYLSRTQLPEQVVAFIKDYQWTRTPDLIPELKATTT